MADTPPTKLSKTQLQAHIRAVAADSRRVLFTEHALVRMRKRHLSREVVLAVLTRGRLIRSPEWNSNKGNLECRMEYYAVGMDIAAIVAVSDDDPDLLVITAMPTGN
jgi:hypothetical protein